MPGESCAEIKASEGDSVVVSGNYWLDSIKPGQAVSVPCNMLTGGKTFEPSNSSLALQHFLFLRCFQNILASCHACLANSGDNQLNLSLYHRKKSTELFEETST